jgi:hypothetical protein
MNASISDFDSFIHTNLPFIKGSKAIGARRFVQQIGLDFLSQTVMEGVTHEIGVLTLIL